MRAHHSLPQVAEQSRRGAVAQGVVTYSKLDSSQSQPGGVGGPPVAAHEDVQQALQGTPQRVEAASQQQQPPALALDVGCTQEILSHAAARAASSHALAAQECDAMLQMVQQRAAWTAMTVRGEGAGAVDRVLNFCDNRDWSWRR